MISAFTIAIISLLLLVDLAYTGAKGTIRGFDLDEKGFTKIKEVHRNWYFFAIKALMGQMAKELLRTVDSASRERLKSCLKRVANTKDLRRTARCLLKAREQWKYNLSPESLERDDSKATAFVQDRDQRPWLQNVKRLYFKERQNSNHIWKVKMRKRMKKTPLRILGMQRIKRSPNRLTLPLDLKDDRNNFEVKNEKQPPVLIASAPKSPIHRVADLFVSLFGKATIDELPNKWSATYRSVLTLTEIMESKQQLPGAQVYNRRIYDLVMDSKENKQNDEIYVPSFLKNAFDIVNSFNGAKNARILSPRFAPLLPDKVSKGFLSPSIFPFYKDDTEQQIMPVPKMLETIGINEKDRERILEMVMEVSGTRETVDKAVKVLQYLTSLGMDEKLLAVNEKIDKVFEQLRSSFTPNQNQDMERKGFTFMEPHQMQKLHQEQNLSEPEILDEIKKYKKLPYDKREEYLWKAVADLAGLSRRRRRRQIQPLVLLKPFVLSPYQFAPVYGFSVLGPVVLSPNLFSPLILNPSLLSPWVLSPAFPLPFIISPYILSPYVLSPLGMAPFVFSPYVLSPNVMTPYFLSPVILSPIVLCPDVLSPMVLGGTILSPGILSPSVLSKSVLMVNILSPTFLS